MSAVGIDLSTESARSMVQTSENTTSENLDWSGPFRTRLAIADTLIVAAAVVIAQLSRVHIDTHDKPLAIGDLSFNYLTVSTVLIIIWLSALALSRSRDIRVVGVGDDEYRRVLLASMWALGLVAIASFALQVDIARGYLALAFPLGIAALCLNRKIWRHWLVRQRTAGTHLADVLVVGSLCDVQYVARRIENAPGAGFRVAAVGIDELPAGATVSIGRRSVPVISRVQDVVATSATIPIEAVVVAGDIPGGTRRIQEMTWELEPSNIEVVVCLPLVDIDSTRVQHRPVDGLPLMHVETPKYRGKERAGKRLVDIVASATGLVFLAPVLLLIAALVKFGSPGPVLFRQDRVGQNGEIFQIVKFRTMTADAESQIAALFASNEGAGPLFKMRDDPRVTTIGRILRRLSLDELPQLWNVLTGTMSLVGPRPALPREVAEYERFASRRLLVQPGITGLWQVSGRSDLDWEQGLRLDLHYVENWSFVRDLVILGRTVSVIVNPRGAY